MPKKESLKIKKLDPEELANKKIILEKWDEIVKWKIKNATQKRFFSLEDREQQFLETTYLIVVQTCPELTWENYLDRLRKGENCNDITKSVIKKTIWIN